MPNTLQRLYSFGRGRLTPLFYAGSSVVTAAAQLVAGFLVIKWITPEELGLWQSVKLFQVYAFILLVGINNGLGRELPFFLGKGEEAFAHRLAATALFYVTVANGVVLIGGVACAIGLARHGDQLVCAILAVTLLIALGFYQHIFTLTFRSKDSFKSLTWIQFVEAGLTLATVPLVYFLGYKGMIARTVLIAFVITSLLFCFRPLRVKILMDWKALKVLLKTGLPIFGLDYVKNSCATLDRVVLLKIGGVRDVGIYALAGIVIQTLSTLPMSLGSYLYPRMTFKFGQTGDPRALWNSGLGFVLLTVNLTIIAAAGAWFILPYFVPAFIPKYLGGLPAAQIVLVAGIFGATTIIADVLWSMKVWRLMVTYQVLSSMLFALGPILGVIFIGKSLEGVAWGTVIGSVGRSILAFGLTFCATRRVNPMNSALTEAKAGSVST